jgi:hypothetical protein
MCFDLYKNSTLFELYQELTPKGLEAIFMPFLEFGQAIVKAIFIKNSWIFLWACGFSSSFKAY